MDKEDIYEIILFATIVIFIYMWLKAGVEENRPRNNIIHYNYCLEYEEYELEILIYAQRVYDSIIPKKLFLQLSA